MSAERSVTLRLSYVDHGSPLTPYWQASLDADDDWHGACGARASGPAGALVLLLAYVAQNPGYWREPPWMTCEVVDAIAASRVAHTQAQRLTAMYPTTDAPTIDPRTAAEDRCRTFWDSCTDFEKATLRWLSGRESWTDQRALDVRTREWRRGK